MRKRLHDFDRMLEDETRRVKASPISKKNKQLILEYNDHCLSRGLSKARIVRNSITLRLAARRIGKGFGRYTSKDVERIFLEMKKEGKAESTIITDRIVLKGFFKWLNNGEEAECTKWYKCGGFKNLTKLPEELLVQEEVLRMIKLAANKRDKAFISVLWESGARIGEISGMQIKNVSFDDFGCRILIEGKTGMRKIRLVNAAPYLLEWINAHPNADDMNAPLWVSIGQSVGNQLTYRAITKMLKCVARRAKVKKPVNPHNFRHSRATFLAQYLTEALMKEYFGWVQDSKMAARYIHLSGKQVDDAILKLHGPKKAGEKDDVLKRKECPRCKHSNDPNNKICEKCWLPLDPAAYHEVEQAKEADEKSSILLVQLLDLLKNLSKESPARAQEVLTTMQKQLIAKEGAADAP